MNIETLLQIDPKVWPVAGLAFLRILTVFVFLPIFGETAVTTKVRIILAILLTICLWPMIIGSFENKNLMLQNWTPLFLATATLREVFFGFSVGFAAKTLTYAVTIGSQLVGTNMGFQAATLFSPTTNSQESGFGVFKAWLLLVCLLSFDVHHIFLREIFLSFQDVPLGGSLSVGSIAQVATAMVHKSFVLGLRLAAPLLLVQLLITLALGLLNRALPQLNALVMQFPLSFSVSFVVLFFTAATYVKLLGSHSQSVSQSAIEMVHRSFAGSGGP